MTSKPPGQPGFESLLTPVSADDFFSRYWEKMPLHISRTDEAFFARLLSVEQIDQLLSSGEHTFPNIQLTQSSDPVSTEEYVEPDNTINPLRLIQRHHQGATIVLSQAQDYLPQLANFTRRMQAAFQLQCQTNVYLSPPARQGFNPHYDSHDVFILQVSGSKTFNFYNGGIDLPLNSHRFDKNNTVVGDKNESICLTPGDTLYIPRGVLHDAIAHDNTSLHITLGVYSITLLQLLQETLQVAAEKDIRYRQSVPPIPWQQHSGRAEFQQASDAVISTLLTADNLDIAIAKLRDHISLETKPDIAGLLKNGSGNEDLTLSTVIRLRNEALLGVEHNGPTLRLRAFGQILEFEEPMSHAVELIVKQQRVQLDKLPLTDNKQKFALTAQLLRENIVAIEKPGFQLPQ
ncbi:hypothetical protein AB833_05580 [Chromatiales bacterium (ex Bugula neritina AB1)]|nr:hypothetical protein AB833_05580 [Chromatiales bacterium (ex Bugula neritina AB1)]